MTKTTKRKYLVPVYMFKRNNGEIAPCFGLFPNRANAVSLQKVTKLLAKFKIVRAYLSEYKP